VIDMDFLKRPSTESSGSFLPEDYIERKTAGRATIIGLTLFGVVMFGVVGAFLVTNRRWSEIRVEQTRINEQYEHEARKIDQLKSLEAQRAVMLAKAEVTAALIEKVPRSILLAELITRMPRDITLLDLELKSKRLDVQPKPDAAGAKAGKEAAAKVKNLTASVSGKAKGKDEPAPEVPKARAPRFEFALTLAGVAANNNDIAEYLGQLQACPLLASVELQFIKETIISDVGMRRFEIVAQLRPEADAHDLIAIPVAKAKPAIDAAQSDEAQNAKSADATPKEGN